MPLVTRINQDDLRNHNLSVVLSAMASSPVPLSRAALAKKTGLTKATLSLLSGILLKNKVIRQLEPSLDSDFGRPSTPLAFDPTRWVGLGMQINTDGLGCIILDLNGDVVERIWQERSMEGADPGTIFGLLDGLVRPVERRIEAQGRSIVGAGLALPGLVHHGDTLLMARNLGWEALDLRGFNLVKRLHVTADNEATLAAIAQIPGYACQRSRDDWPLDAQDSFIYVSTDIGIGGAVVRDGQVVSGDNGFAGEIGHVSVNMDGPVCRCGRRGCLELYAGRRAMMEAAGLASGRDAMRTELLPGLLRAWRVGDAKAVAAVHGAASALASALASTVNLIDCGTIVLGGIWSEFGDGLRARLERDIQRQVLARDEVGIRLLFPPVCDHPAMFGAALAGLSHLMRDPLRFLEA